MLTSSFKNRIYLKTTSFSSLQFNSIFRKELLKASTNILSKAFISGDILQFNYFNFRIDFVTWKVLRLPYWIWNDFMIYIGLGLENTWTTYWTQIDFIITKQGSCQKSMKTYFKYLMSNQQYNQVQQVRFPQVRLCFVYQKPNLNTVCSKVRYFSYPPRVTQVIINPNHCPKGLSMHVSM